MPAIYINDSSIPFSELILLGLKTWETRSRNMLGRLVGKRVAIISTGRNRKPQIVGYATISEALHVTQDEFDNYRSETFVPQGSKYDCSEKGKWMYRMTDARPCYPKDVPVNIVRHGRSWCEIPKED